MARIRTIKPKFFDDVKIGRISRDARLTYIGLWIFSDDIGVVVGDTVWLKSKIFPYDQIQVQQFEKWMNELVINGFICLLSYNGERFIYLPTFTRHQVINRPNTDDLNIPKDLIYKNKDKFTEQSLNNHGTFTEQSLTIIGKEKENNNIPPYNPPKGESGFMEKLSLRQKELEEWEAALRTKEQELIKIEANLKAKKKKELPDIDFVGNDFKEVFTTWLEYKRERRENYKSEKSLKLAYSKLLQLSGNDPQKAASIVEQSMANNWAGLFDLKPGNNGNRNNQNERDCRQRKFDSAVAVATRVQEAAAKRRAELKAEGVID